MTRESTELRTVLVIDEDLAALEATRTMLETTGYRVITRDRSAGSISAIVKEKPDIVLVELNIARLNGETIAKILNKTQPRPPVIVLFHSALPIETLRLKALAAGAQGYVQKTDSAAELARRIAHCVANSGSLSKNGMRAVTPIAHEDDMLFEREPLPSSGPRRPTDATVVARRDAAPASTRNGTLKALFVDDNWSLLRAYRTALGSELQAEFVTSGDEAVQRVLSDSPPDIVVCDIVMPFVSGTEIYTRAVAADPRWRERFLFLTGASSTRVVIDFLNEHEGRVLFKPVPSNRLLETIREMDSTAKPRISGSR
jgi:DNA-binding response OmpR family regulator